MRKRLVRRAKWALTSVGARLQPRYLHSAQMVVNYMKLGRFMAERFPVDQRVPNREAVFDVVAERVREEPVLYLEFGVYEGRSMKYWSQALRHPDSVLHGFDSFEGLPEDFDIYVRGTFDCAGQPPVISDPRVRFWKGWFDNVLPDYQIPDHQRLVLVIDADLYSSTIFVLRHLRPYLTAGTFVYFDDFSRPDHEPRALVEFIEESGLEFAPLVTDYSLNRVFFECKGARSDASTSTAFRISKRA